MQDDPLQIYVEVSWIRVCRVTLGLFSQYNQPKGYDEYEKYNPVFTFILRQFHKKLLRSLSDLVMWIKPPFITEKFVIRHKTYMFLIWFYGGFRISSNLLVFKYYLAFNYRTAACECTVSSKWSACFFMFPAFWTNIVLLATIMWRSFCGYSE